MPHEFGSDGYLRLEATRWLAHGQFYDQPYSLMMSIVALPFLYLGNILAEFNMFVLFGGLAIFAAILWRHVPLTLIRRAVLIVLAASMFGYHTQQFFGEVLTAMSLTVGLAFIVVNLPTIGFCIAAIGVINAPATLPALFLMSADRARRLRKLWPALWPAAVCAIAIMLEFWIRRGSPFATGYEGDHGEKSIMPYAGLPGFSYPFVFGVLSILFSFGKGLALYAPGLWLLCRRTTIALPEPLRMFQRHSVAIVIGLVLIYAKWWAWSGGWFWGPRFFVFASIPASIAIAAHLSDADAKPSAKLLTLAILAWSAWVWIDGSVYGQNEMAICNVNPNVEPLCWYSPEYSALFRPFIVPKALSVNDGIVIAYAVSAAAVLALPLVRDVAAAVTRRTR